MKCLISHSGSTTEKAVNYEEINSLARLLERENQAVTYIRIIYPAHARVITKIFQKSHRAAFAITNYQLQITKRQFDAVKRQFDAFFNFQL
jgi:hypothetical protein